MNWGAVLSLFFLCFKTSHLRLNSEILFIQHSVPELSDSAALRWMDALPKLKKLCVIMMLRSHWSKMYSFWHVLSEYMTVL